jgi:H/ACA ribonucleoprotein complex subunit 3
MLRKCNKCEEYTLLEKCPHCDDAAQLAHPIKFSPDDKYWMYKQKLKTVN